MPIVRDTAGCAIPLVPDGVFLLRCDHPWQEAEAAGFDRNKRCFGEVHFA